MNILYLRVLVAVYRYYIQGGKIARTRRHKFKSRPGHCCERLGDNPTVFSHSLRENFLIQANRNLYKAVPLQAWSGPEGSRKLRFPDFMTTSQEGGKVVSVRHRPHLPQGNLPGTHFC